MGSEHRLTESVDGREWVQLCVDGMEMEGNGMMTPMTLGCVSNLVTPALGQWLVSGPVNGALLFPHRHMIIFIRKMIQ